RRAAQPRRLHRCRGAGRRDGDRGLDPRTAEPGPRTPIGRGAANRGGARVMNRLRRRSAQPMLPPDEALVERVRGGDVAAYEVLMRRHNQRVFRTARAVLGHDEEAEEVAQDAWVSAWQHLGDFEGRARFSTWLLRI